MTMKELNAKNISSQEDSLAQATSALKVSLYKAGINWEASESIIKGLKTFVVASYELQRSKELESHLKNMAQSIDDFEGIV
jgi:signal recognition particle GTPase